MSGSDHVTARTTTEHATADEQEAARVNTIVWANRHGVGAAGKAELLDMLGLDR